MYMHIKKYEIRFSDTDAYDRLKLSALLALLQESAGLSADELGMGYKTLQPLKRGFVLANWYVEIKRPIMQGEHIEVRTWPIKPRHLIFLRDFEIFSGGEKVGAASSRWSMFDIEKYTMVPITKFFNQGFFDSYSTSRSVDFNDWKIPVTDDAETVYKKVVSYSDIDHYFHANNTKYADILLDAFPVEDFARKYVGKAQISYINQCKQDEIIEISKKDFNGVHIIEGKVDSGLRVQARIEFNEI